MDGALCGVCLAVRDRGGQAARALVSTDAVAGAVLVAELSAARDSSVGPDVRPRAGEPATREGARALPLLEATRTAGPCPARGMRRATVWDGPAAADGAGVSLLTAAIRLRDDAEDGDLPLSRATSRPARAWADRLERAATPTLRDAGIDVARVRAAAAASRRVEQRRSVALADWVSPVASSYAAVFDVVGVGDLGACIGRATLLADAVGDLHDDRLTGRPNPVLSGACTVAEAAAVVDEDVSRVGREVRQLLPGSLAALLWGTAWRRGIDTLVGRVVTRPRHGHVCATADPDPEPTWPSATPSTDELTDGPLSQPATTPIGPADGAPRRDGWCRRCVDRCDVCSSCGDCCSCCGDCCSGDCCSCDCCDCGC